MDNKNGYPGKREMTFYERVGNIRYALTSLTITFLILSGVMSCPGQTILIEAESFPEKGGWVTDQQSMDQMGSPYLMAHGYGIPVSDAITAINISEKGKYRVWARTRNWMAPWGIENGPGKFRILINHQSLETIFGTEGNEWHWQDGGMASLDKGTHEIALQDLTGFNGRCDAILLTRDIHFVPPDHGPALIEFRRKIMNLPDKPENAGEFDLVVTGGGMAGICAAISAARLGCRVALIQDRPVLGGNNSSEVRVGLSGLIYQEPYPLLGKLVDEVGSVGHWNLWEAEQNPSSERSKKIFEVIRNNPEKKIHNAGPASNYGDDKKQNLVEKEPNISLFLNTHVTHVDKMGGIIHSITGINIETGKETKFSGKLFADCTGDGNIGYLAGADFRVGRESFSETREPRAPQQADNQVMGTSVQWYAEKLENRSTFPECPWAVHFTDETCQQLTRGDWNWETGMNYNQVTDIEYIRDYGLRAVYGNWSFLKNNSYEKEKYADYQLKWVAFIGGKRESRRLLGDVILTEKDILGKIPYPDACFTTTWGVDLHYPVALKGFLEEPFLSQADVEKIEPYAVPYRCLYSRNIDNLFMAGRNISVTHVALGTVRVQRTTGMMGEVVGMAASLCRKFSTTPRGVYENYLDELKKLLVSGPVQK